MTITADQFPGYRVGTWSVDPVHSSVAFSVRHLVVAKVRGKFGAFEATLQTAENPLDSRVTASAEVASVDTNQPNRDAHLATGDFFLAEEHPTIDFVSTGVREEGGKLLVDGDLTMRGVTKPVTFDFEFGGFITDNQGNTKAGFTAETVIDRGDFGVSFNSPLEAGGMTLGNDVTITLDMEMVYQG